MRRSLMLLTVALGPLSACASAPKVAAPEGDALKAEQLAITEQTLTGFTAEARLEVTNTGDGPLQISSETWTLSLDGTPLTGGTTNDLDKSADPGQTLSFRVPASAEIVHNEDQLKAFVARGDQPIPIMMTGTVNLRQGGKTTALEFARAGQLRAPRLPIPKLNDAALGRSDDDVTVSFYLGIENQNPFEVKLKSISYKAELDGVEVGSGMASTGDRLPPSETAEYPIQENVTTLDRSKTQIPYHLTGTVDLGLTQVPIDLTGVLTYSNKPVKAQPSKHKHKIDG